VFISFCVVKTKGAVIVNVLFIGSSYRTSDQDSSNNTGYTDNKSNDGTFFLSGIEVDHPSK